MPRLLDADEIVRQLIDLPQWEWDGTSLLRQYEAASFPTAIAIVDDVAVVAEEMNHHPDIDIRWRTLQFRLSTHTEKGVTQLDIELAHRIEQTFLK